MFKIAGLIFSTFLLSSCTVTQQGKPVSGSSTESSGAKNIVFMIVDGMGFEHVKAARIYNGMKPFNFEKFTCKTKVTTCSVAGANKYGHCETNTDDITDSAASATAIATGKKVTNGVISRNLPRSEEDIETILEQARNQHKSTGIVATKLFTDATPAAFVSHANDRTLTNEILRDIFFHTRPNVILAADTDLHRQFAHDTKKYRMAHTTKELRDLVKKIDRESPCTHDCPFVYGGFGQYDMIPGVYENKSGLPLEITPSSKFEELQIPHLSEMTDAALKILSKNEKGFFLMVESSMPDMISHYHHQIDKTPKSPKAIEVLIREMLEVDNTIKVIEAFVEKNPETLVILTADHETGGLVIEAEKTSCLGKDFCIPKVVWTSQKYEATDDSPVRHTGVDVPLYAVGKGAERFCVEKVNNTDIAKLAIAK